ncbi:MAG: hypothetical protein DRP62_05525, partial [Planctomycetota bacterium]
MFFVLIPFILVFLYLLPSSLKEFLILVPKNPNPWSVFFSSYVHSSFWHFLNNLVGYLVLILLIFYLEENRSFFHYFSFLNFILLPLLSSFLVIVALSSFSESLGFSAVVSGFNGYLLYSVYMHLKKEYFKNLNCSFLWLLLIINFALFSLSSRPEFLFLLLPLL